MKPFKLRIDWMLHEHYGQPVVVELHVMDEEPRVLRRFDTTSEAAGWARKWLADRGFGFLCDIDGHQRRGDTHVTLHAWTGGAPGQGQRPGRGTNVPGQPG